MHLYWNDWNREKVTSTIFSQNWVTTLQATNSECSYDFEMKFQGKELIAEIISVPGQFHLIMFPNKLPDPFAACSKLEYDPNLLRHVTFSIPLSRSIWKIRRTRLESTRISQGIWTLVYELWTTPWTCWTHPCSPSCCPLFILCWAGVILSNLYSLSFIIRYLLHA